MTSEPLPALRPVEMIPTRDKGRMVVVMRDPEGICEGMVVLPLPAFFIASCFDGANRVADIQNAFHKQFQHEIQSEDVIAINRQLDSHGLLLTPNYYQRRLQLEREYEALPQRPAAHAGEAYPDDPQALKAVFNEYFTSKGGAGAVDHPQASSSREVAGVVLPHIDPRCGGRCASWGLKALHDSPQPDLFIIFGTSHQALPDIFSVADKDFATPLGTVQVDHEFVGQLQSKFAPGRYSGGSLIHKSEHSIEFQAVFLHALYGEPAPFKIVPILCASLGEFMVDPTSLAKNQEITEFVNAIRETAASSGKRVCYIAGADLAHMGRKFDDPFGLSDDLIDRTSRHDHEALVHVERLDPQSFFASIASGNDPYKTCGLAPMYAMLRCMDASEGKLLKYDYNLEASTDSMVTFCSMVFYR